MTKNTDYNTNIVLKELPPKFKDTSIIEMHTTEHILNQTMIRLFGCERSKNAHIERKKSKCDYQLHQAPTTEQLKEIETSVNNVIGLNLMVTDELVLRNKLPKGIDLSKLPEEAGEMIRIVRIGNYDTCACIGTHVKSTSEIGLFRILSSDFANGRLRLRWKVETKSAD